MPANDTKERRFLERAGDHLDPIQVPMLEALWRIGEPLSAICMVDALDGYLSMWEAADHLEALQKLDVVEPASDGTSRGDFNVPYRLKTFEFRNLRDVPVE